ncbi:MAG: MFS transporter [Desulfobacteraceae bacterium]
MKIFFLGLFWSLWFLVFSTRTSLSPLLPVIEDELHLSHAMAGSLYLCLAVGYTTSLLLSGIVAPRFGYKRSIILGYLTLAVTLASPWIIQAYGFFALVFLFVGAGGGLYLPSAIPLLTKLFDARHWGKALAIHDTAASVSILLTPFLVTLVLRLMNWRGFFLILGGCCAAAITLFSIFVPDAPPKEGEQQGSLKQILMRRELWVMALLWMVAATANMGLYSIIPLFLVKGKGISLETANTIFGLSRISGVLTTLLAGFLVDRFGVRRILVTALFLTGLSTIGMATAPTLPLLLVMLFIQAPLSNAFFPVGLVAISKLSNVGERSLFTGATIAGGTITGLGLAPFLLGAAADAWSFQAGILITGGVIVAACLLPLLLDNV